MQGYASFEPQNTFFRDTTGQNRSERQFALTLKEESTDNGDSKQGQRQTFEEAKVRGGGGAKQSALDFQCF